VAALGKQVKAIIVPEMNLGQMNLEVERVVKGTCPVISLGRVDGEPINPGQIMELVKEVK
jgi:2-oxoglutarate ferredoxin oxidoreductase subunit alpha